jgi:hypothetical protein
VQWTEERVATVGNDPGTGGSLAETFVVRLWEPQQAAGLSPGGLRGLVRHARSGRSATFTDGESLLEFLRAARHAPEREIGGES